MKNSLTLHKAIKNTADWNRALDHIQDACSLAGDPRWESGAYMFFKEAPGSTMQAISNKGFDYRMLALNLIQEEVDELKEAVRKDNKIEILDGAADILFTVFGLVAKAGLEDYLAPAFEEVMASNWTKVVDEPVFDENGKVGKPDTYRKPDIARVIREVDEV